MSFACVDFFYRENQCVISYDKAVPLLMGRDFFNFFFNKRSMILTADLVAGSCAYNLLPAAPLMRDWKKNAGDRKVMALK